MIASGECSGRWARAERGLAAAFRWGGIVFLVVLLILVTAEILIRFFPLFFLGWADEIVELAFAWMVFLGTAALWRSKEHITIDFIPQALAGSTAGRVLEIIVSLLALGFLVVFTWEGWILTLQAVGSRTPILELPREWWYAAIPLSGVVMIGHTLAQCVRAIRTAGARQSPAETS